MSNGKGLITVLIENRLVDRIARFAYLKGLWKMTGYYSIFDDKTGKEIGRIACAYGNKTLIRFLSWLTEYRGKDAIEQHVKWQ